LPQIYCNLNHYEAQKLAYEFSAPVITNIDNTDNSLRQTIDQLNIPLLVYVAGEAMRFNEDAITLGVSGTMNVITALKMIDHPKEPQSFNPIFSKDQDWLRAHRSGILFSEVELGQRIRQGQRIGYISDPFSAQNEAEMVKADQDGIIVGINRHPLIHEGQTIFKVASFIDNSRAEIALEAWGDSLKSKVE
jgi:predicted deacylase